MNKERQKLNNLRDMLDGELNRIMVSDDLDELLKMLMYARENVTKLYELRIIELRGRKNEH